MKIRHYTTNDLPILEKFMERLTDYLSSIDSLKRIERKPEYGKIYTQHLLDELEKHQGFIYFAEENDSPIGCVVGAIYKQEPHEQIENIPALYGRVLELYVDQSYRSVGTGKLLLTKAEEEFIKADCTALLIEVMTDNKQAHEFYQRLGYQDRMVDMIKVINK